MVPRSSLKSLRDGQGINRLDMTLSLLDNQSTGSPRPCRPSAGLLFLVPVLTCTEELPTLETVRRSAPSELWSVDLHHVPSLVIDSLIIESYIIYFTSHISWWLRSPHNP